MRPTVLFVDDEPEITDSLRAAMRTEPFTVVTTNSATEGLEVLRQRQVDVVVSDERMPGLGGAAFLSAVRTEFPEVGRVILTGQASVEATIAAINDAQVFRVLTKPCPVDEIVACLNELVEARRLGANGFASVASAEAASAELDEALDAAYLAYQPIYSLDQRRIYGYEALLRTERYAVPSPAPMIEAAIRLNRHWDLDRRVCALVAADLVARPHDKLVFVNLLPESLADPWAFSETGALRPYASQVALEITERAPLESNDQLTAKLAELREQGFRLVLDDLGAGYAGLTSFVTLKPDIVKFDLELVRHVDRSETSSKLVASMVTLCQELGVLTVAEGIETRQELDHLADLGCDLFQGFGLAMPARPWTPSSEVQAALDVL
jgi:EAL domain-containing protein (putative c-di-GMP-specific phosphodiesterase class I)/CheY-like chemotaxis protein